MRRFFLCFGMFCSFLSVHSQNIQACVEVNAINTEIIKYVTQHLNKKVGRGECWDLAAEALDKSGAVWDHAYNYGKKINYRAGDCVTPGDILQFKNVTIKYQKGQQLMTETYQQHTAIVYQVKSDGSLVIAQQNTSDHGRKVSLDVLHLQQIKSGEVSIFRPHQQ
jgi:hypothetical protein